MEACQLARIPGGKSIETADINVLLECDAAASLIFTLANAFNADNVQRRSIFVDKIDKNVLSPHLTYTMMGHLKGA